MLYATDIIKTETFRNSNSIIVRKIVFMAYDTQQHGHGNGLNTTTLYMQYCKEMAYMDKSMMGDDYYRYIL